MKTLDTLILFVGIVGNACLIGANFMNALWLTVLGAPVVFVALSFVGIGISIFSIGMFLWLVALICEEPKTA
jgi:hypothetical protein